VEVDGKLLGARTIPLETGHADAIVLGQQISARTFQCLVVLRTDQVTTAQPRWPLAGVRQSGI
jgi:hypothetical protein